MTDHTHTGELRRSAQDAAFDLDPVIEYIRASSLDWRRPHRIRGVRLIHGWLGEHPGGTWQEKWVAADGDSNVESVFVGLQRSRGTEGTSPWNTAHPRYLRHGLATLVALGLIRPSPRYLLIRNSKIALRDVLEEHEEEFEAVVRQTARVAPVSRETAWVARHALACMIATTGRPLSEITVEDWTTVEAARADLLRPFRQWEREEKRARAGGRSGQRPPAHLVTDNNIYTLRWAYSAAVRAGAVAAHPHPPAGAPPIPPTLDIALSKPRTTEALLEPQCDVLTGRLYDFVLRVIEEWYSGHDYNTRRQVIGYLGVYMRAVNAVMPSHDSLRVPRKMSAALVDHLSIRPSRNDPTSTENRESLPMIIQTVRRFYELAQLTVEEAPEYEDLLGPFPIPRTVANALSRKYRKQARSRLHSQIRDRITTLEQLVPAAQWLASEAQTLLSLAQDTPEGKRFEHRGIQYSRHTTPTHPDSPRPLIQIRRIDGPGTPRDVARIAHRAARTRAFVVLLRHTGIRREEAIEVAQDDLGFAMIDGAKVPSLYVGPSKTDTSRTVALHPEAIEALVDLIQSHSEMYGEVPIAIRKDHYERVTLPPRRYLFQNFHDGAFSVPDVQIFAEWIDSFILDYNVIARDTGQATLRPMRPHDFRRIFATDLLDKDVPIESVRQLLGHANIATTAVYDHTSWDRAARQFLNSHRRDKHSDETQTRCPHCSGTGHLALGTGRDNE